MGALWRFIYGPDIEADPAEARALMLRVAYAERELKVLQRAAKERDQ